MILRICLHQLRMILLFIIPKNTKIAKNTKASFCLTTLSLKNELPKTCFAIIVDNVLVSTSKITSLFYPDSVNDDFDKTANIITDTKFDRKLIMVKMF